MALRATAQAHGALDASPVLLIGRHLVGVWNGHFPESEKYFSEAEISRKMPEIPQKSDFHQISGSEI